MIFDFCVAINELNEQFTLEYLSQEFEVTVRTISNWKSGSNRPMGMKAIHVYVFHAKHRKVLLETGNTLPVNATGESIIS